LSSAENLQTIVEENHTTRPEFLAQVKAVALDAKAKAKPKDLGFKNKAKEFSLKANAKA